MIIQIKNFIIAVKLIEWYRRCSNPPHAHSYLAAIYLSRECHQIYLDVGLWLMVLLLAVGEDNFMEFRLKNEKFLLHITFL